MIYVFLLSFRLQVSFRDDIDEKKRQSTGNVFHLDCSLFRFEPQKTAPPKFSKYKTNGAFLDCHFFQYSDFQCREPSATLFKSDRRFVFIAALK